MANPPRTGAQKALRITSIVMIVFGVLMIVAAATIIAAGASADTLGADEAVNFHGTDTTAGLVTIVVGILVLVLGLIELVVAVLGLRGSNDASKIGPYRALSWGISIVILAMLAYGWLLSGNFVNDPFLLVGNAIYLLLCTTLADTVKKERDQGIVGEAQPEVERSGSQKALRVVVIVLIVFAIATLLISVAMLALAVAGISGGVDLSAEMSGVDSSIEVNGQSLPGGIALLITLSVVLIFSAILDLVVGILGLRGANNPQKIKPFFVLCIIGLVIEVVSIGGSIAQGTFSSIGSSDVVELLVIGACTWLAYDIMRHRPALEV